MPVQGIRVLHTDDEPGFAELAAEFVHRSNAEIQVTVATSGPEALATLEEGEFDCVVSDFDMPAMTGIEFLEGVRENNPDLPFILFTGKGSEEIASEAISKGVSDYLQKESGTDQYRILANRITNLVRQYRAESELATQVKQQRVTAQLGKIALRNAGLDELFEQAVEMVATTLDNEYAKILEYHPNDGELFLRAGVGWQEGLVGQATVGDGADSQAGHTLRSEEPIVVSDLDSEERFRGPALLTDHDVRSGISVVIGDPADPWGILGTHSTRPKSFDEDHVTFIKNVANVLASAIEQSNYKQQLERSKARFDAILEHTETPMFMKDDSGAYLFVNQAYRDLFGLQDEEIIGRTDYDIHPAEMADEVTKNDQCVIETGKTLETEERIILKDAERLYHSTKVPIYDTGDRADSEQPVAVFGLAQDITELKEQEVQLRNESNRFRAVFEKAFDAMVLADDHGQYTDVNASAVELFGLPEGELIGSSIQDFTPEDFDFDGAWGTFQESEAERGTFPLVRPDGTRRMVKYAATTNVTPGEHLSVLRDVTERERREQNPKRFETIVETAGDPVYTLDPEGRFTFVNNALVALTGYQKDMLLDIHVSIVMDKEDVERGEELIRSLLSGERDRGTFEMDLVTASGQCVPCENHIGVLPFDDEFRGTVGILRDLTERKEREVQLQRQNERLDAFTFVVSHDLRNPLTVASGRLDLARDECESEHLADVEHSLQRMETLLEDLLELARHGESVGEREPFVLAELVENCWANVETNDANLNIEIDETINADKTRLQQVFENLIRNAVEHSGEGVTMTAGELDGGFYIEDDGPGIPEGNRKEIFEAGYSTSDEGTGFGLSIVKEIVKAHGWSIELSESDEGGARFEITGVDFVQ